VVSEEVSDHEKCIRQFVPNVVRNVKFLSSQQKASQFIAKNVIERRKDSDSRQL
jgi:hypothetical protein